MEEDRLIDGEVKTEEIGLEKTLRPESLAEYFGQQKIKDNLEIFMSAARQRNEPLEHVLFYGPPGLGKTTLAHIVAKEMNSNIKVTSGPAIERAGDLAAILTNLEPGDVLFIDEIHRLNKTIEEILYPAMEDFALDIVIGKGPSAKTLRIDLPKFTLIGATTRYSMLSSPLRSRFGSIFRLDYYQPSEIVQILKRTARIFNVVLDNSAADLLAERCRLTPRIANRLLKRVRDYAQVKSNGEIDLELTTKALDLLEVDHCGLDIIDRRILQAIAEKFNGGPVGLSSVAAIVQEESDTIEEIYEPYLMQLGFLTRTPRGRMITELGCQHLGIKPFNNAQPKLID
jgi:Holliday junction DNA helicase RuvB